MRNLKKEHIISNRIHQKWMLERMHDIIMPQNQPQEKSQRPQPIGILKQKDFQMVVESLKQVNLIKNAPDFKTFHQPLAGD
jgi:NitT/TauT family transport system substrate-binding protein